MGSTLRVCLPSSWEMMVGDLEGPQPEVSHSSEPKTVPLQQQLHTCKLLCNLIPVFVITWRPAIAAS